MTATHYIIHTLQLAPGTIDTARELFEKVVPELASRFDGWRGARLTADREKNQVVTIGTWADAEQMQAFLSQPAFNEAMAGFAEFFTAPPQTTITEVVTEVLPRS
jgi:heme-degrading monooxygenase HmoA